LDIGTSQKTKLQYENITYHNLKKKMLQKCNATDHSQ